MLKYRKGGKTLNASTESGAVTDTSIAATGTVVGLAVVGPLNGKRFASASMMARSDERDEGGELLFDFKDLFRCLRRSSNHTGPMDAGGHRVATASVFRDECIGDPLVKSSSKDQNNPLTSPKKRKSDTLPFGFRTTLGATIVPVTREFGFRDRMGPPSSDLNSLVFRWRSAVQVIGRQTSYMVMN